jgi:phosphocarrier protein HPr
MIQRTVSIDNELGLHARAAAKFVKLASQFECDVKLCRLGNDESIDGKSILGILLMAAARGTRFQITFDGCDEELAAKEIADLIRNRFGEQK